MKHWWQSIVLIGILTLPITAFAAVAHVDSGGSFCGAGATCTGSFTVTTGTLLVCGFDFVNGSGFASSPTYNGVAMTSIAHNAFSGNRDNYLYYLEGPASGSNTLSMTTNTTPNYQSWSCDTFTGENPSSPIDGSQFTSGTAPLTVSYTTNTPGVLGIVQAFIGPGSGGLASGGPGWTAAGDSGNSTGNWVANSAIPTPSTLTAIIDRTGGGGQATILAGITCASCFTPSIASSTEAANLWIAVASTTGALVNGSWDLVWGFCGFLLALWVGYAILIAFTRGIRGAFR